MSSAMWVITFFFLMIMGIAGFIHFFSSDYAQKKWNPDNKTSIKDI